MDQQQPGTRGGEPSVDTVLAAVSVTGASISTLGGLLQPETVSASDARIARIDELQFDLGVGPCWDAVATGRPVLEPDLRASPRASWPGFSEAVLREQIAALFAVPMLVGPLRIGAIDLYDLQPRTLDGEELARTVSLAAVLGRQVLRRAIELADPEAFEPVSRHSRRTVHQATGFVIAQLGVSVEDAELLIQASAYAEGRPMQEIAEQIVSRERAFSATSGAIEDVR
jgi:hypothetical protein